MNTSKSGDRPIVRKSVKSLTTSEGPPITFHPHFEQDQPGLITHFEREEESDE